MPKSAQKHEPALPDARRWFITVTITEGEAFQMARGSLPAGVQNDIIGMLLDCRQSPEIEAWRRSERFRDKHGRSAA